MKIILLEKNLTRLNNSFTPNPEGEWETYKCFNNTKEYYLNYNTRTGTIERTEK
jgi:hypothetical protein